MKSERRQRSEKEQRERIQRRNKKEEVIGEEEKGSKSIKRRQRGKVKRKSE